MNKFKTKSFQKGFVGPIGDDLPSLIPIVTALLLFFSIFAITLNTYNTKNLDITRQIEMTSVARELKGDSMIVDLNQFKAKCHSTQLKKYPYNFMAAIYPSEKNIAQFVPDFISIASAPSLDSINYGENILTDTIYDTGEPYFCSYKKIAARSFNGKEKNYLLRYYPVAVSVVLFKGTEFPQYVIIPGIMAMVVWE